MFTLPSEQFLNTIPRSPTIGTEGKKNSLDNEDNHGCAQSFIPKRLRKFNYLVKKQKKLAKKDKSESVEIARDAGGEQWIQAVAKVYYSPIDLTSNDTALSLTERLKIANYKSALFKYEVLKKEIENDPELLKTHLQNMVHSGLSDHGYHQKSKIKTNM
uniref:Uncharacterized protein n=1 Tax=Wuchereria bancrofti TaxID=6293 RepID=A0A1I8EEM3_WUCBA